MMASPRREVRGSGPSVALEDDAAVQLSRASVASAARADPDAGGDALDRAAQADLLVHEESRHSDAPRRRTLL
ncbi:hypothetical protein ACFV2N_37670 [Streptomyces sp. NPDC059680]|uniref:hypothetical protein n=1 Tax=Streptomyces sp. NPDC059680 TaxID=3346904 RepID=UPI003697B755